ncbi:unnamed protein product, partial [Vitis vinifera]
MSWPWKKKSSDKAGAEKIVAALESAGVSLTSAGSQGNQENYKKPTYVQISVESYSHLTGLEDQVKTYEDQVQKLEDQITELNEKLSEAHSEMTTKDNLVKQHAKVAEEAVSGWEKAEAEALALKNHLESATLAKLTAEDRASHLDGALKECMRQIRNLKEEHEQNLHDVVLAKTKQWEKIKLELEAKMGDLEQELLRSAAENATLSRTLQERSNMLFKMSEEKSQAEAEIELLKSNIESCEREINSLKYELHLVSKELEIRNEEKNMSIRSAEVANKQHLEGVKKIAKLEAECQRLRGLVRKKLPGPAALAQMKLEVESLGRDYGETRQRRSPVKPPSPHLSPLPEFSIDNVQQCHKDNEFLTERLLGMEEETKMLKEALAKRNSELQASRNICAKTASKLQNLEAQLQMNNQQKSPPKSNLQIPNDGSLSQNASNPPSMTSMSEDGNDDAVSCAESWATGLVSGLSQFKKENANHLELMDDFLEMEKLACLSNNSNGAFSKHDLDSLANQLRSRISMVFESVSEDSDTGKILEEIKRVLQDTHDTLHQHSACPEDAGVTAEREISLSQDCKPGTDTLHIISQELAAAISQIHEFVLFLGKEAMAIQGASPDGNGWSRKIEDFSATVNKVLCRKMSVIDFIFDLSNVLAKASELNFNILGYKGAGEEINSSDCIDKVALPENKVVQKDTSGERYPNGCAHISDSTSDPEVPHDGNLVPGFKSNAASCNCSLEEFEQLKSEKDTLEMHLARCTENLESTKSQLQETEQLLAEAKSQLTSAQKLNSLADTQLKCMAESYRSLETRAEELETEVNLLRGKTETLESELQEEKRSHENALIRCKDLQEQLERNEGCSVCAMSSAADIDVKTKQERELASAADKLAECQETIFLLGKQLNAMRPQTDLLGSPQSERSQRVEVFHEDEPTTSGESPLELYNTPRSPSETESNLLLRSPVGSKHPKHRPTKSNSSSSAPTPEKQSRGFSRFFSSKGKNGH